ncbi:hypothetical protein [Scytonema sp. UIC 10036]|uniref:hypothetical protein n=1 Tax=Scytonema sp. UIC 10036 TaxID=2304196 RepID=UPI001A9B69E9|nr:hypothetical protein [Scytonema sp. UIC 10036]
MNTQAYRLQSLPAPDETESIKRKDKRSLYERFCVVAKDDVDGSYYVGRILPKASQPDYFCWCHTYEQLNLGILMDGYLSESNDEKQLPLLVIKQKFPQLSDRIHFQNPLYKWVS